MLNIAFDIFRATAEQLKMELHAKLGTMQTQRDVLQKDLASLQGQLHHERSSRSQASGMQHELESKSHYFTACFM